MSDRDDITDVLTRYATGIDSRNWDLFRTCFTDDARFDYGAIGSWDDPDSLTRYMRTSHSGPSLHRLTNFVIDIRGDEATARTYLDGVVMGPRGIGVVHTYGWYDDILRRTSQGWKISRRTTVLHGTRLPGPLSLLPPTIGTRLAGLVTRWGRKRG